MFGKIIGFFFSSIFPVHNGEPEVIYRWRLTVAGSIVFIGIAQVVLIILIFGWAPWFFSGFSRTSDLTSLRSLQTELRSLQTEVRVGQLERQILDTLERQCHAITEKNQEALSFATQRLQDQLGTYSDLTGRGYRLPGCQEIVSYIGK